jgi:hypothetical protein
MANVRAFRSGNWSDTNPATSPWGTGGVLYAPAPEDDVYANSFTVTVNNSPTVVSVSTRAATSLLWKDGATANATAGGGFNLNNGVTLTANVLSGTSSAVNTSGSVSATLYGHVFGGQSPLVKGVIHASTGTLTIYGNITGGSVDTNDGASNTVNGTLTIFGNVTGGGNNSSGAVNSAGGIINITGNVLGTNLGCRGVINSSSGRINISGNVTGGSSASNAHGALNLSTGRIVITTGTVTGGSNAAAYGVHNASTGVIEITGVVNGASSGAPGVRNEVGGQILLTGTATGGSNSAGYGVHNFGTGIVTITGLAAGGTAAVGARNESTGIIEVTRVAGNGFGFGSTGLSSAGGATNIAVGGEIRVRQLEWGLLGQTPIGGQGIKLIPHGTNEVKFNFTSTATPKTLVDASATGDMPAASDVRSGTPYAAGTLLGSLVVPPSASVSYGVPVDATTGTAILSLASVVQDLWAAPASGMTTSGSIGERLKNCATTQSTGDQLASLL